MLTLLPELYLPSRANQQWSESGIDSPELCINRLYYLNYPHKVKYNYNSRGFRDAEWPNDLSDVIWCVGDSFTVGIGCPLEHTWPYVLQQRTGRRTINVSLDGASNNWISRIADSILTQFPGASMVVQWSFLHRRELDLQPILETKFQNFYNKSRGPDWPDCVRSADFENLPGYIKKEMINLHGWTGLVYGDERVTHYIYSTTDEDVANTQQCIAQLPSHVVHTAIPYWTSPGDESKFDNVIQVQQIDYARDGFHYDILTTRLLIEEIIPALALNARR